eukprot:gene15023-biopygen9685
MPSIPPSAVLHRRGSPRSRRSAGLSCDPSATAHLRVAASRHAAADAEFNVSPRRVARAAFAATAAAAAGSGSGGGACAWVVFCGAAFSTRTPPVRAQPRASPHSFPCAAARCGRYAAQLRCPICLGFVGFFWGTSKFIPGMKTFRSLLC